ncbi:flagellar basal body-associated FliL family protein [Coralliovum pocilloporae]|uniref:flagellar basal body-associated FliL family protein n=1 Tax=Coralliovum pocilloporae TaxID=3066369 RepID=UPI0033074EA7
MAEEAEEAEGAAAEGEGEEEGSSGGGKKKLIIIVAAVLLLVIIGGAAAFFLGVFDSEPESAGGDAEAGQVEALPPPKEVVFYDLPELTVNLSSANQRAQYLKLSVALELPDEDTKAAIEPFMPRILDAFQVYLRELRSTDLEGSAGLFRLKEELLRRINTAIYPSKVDGVLFKQILLQ